MMHLIAAFCYGIKKAALVVIAAKIQSFY